MDRLALYRALADRSRYAVYEELAKAGEPEAIGQIASRVGLHPSTVRLHLEKLREAGLAESSPDRLGAVGRPHHLWSLKRRHASPGLEPDGFRLLAQLMADLAAGDPLAAARAAGVGRRHGSCTARPGEHPVQAVVSELARLGFDPEVEEEGPPAAVVTFSRCPFRELAAAYPDLVCQLHRGMTEAIVAEAGLGAVERFATLVDADPCRVEVTVGR